MTATIAIPTCLDSSFLPEAVASAARSARAFHPEAEVLVVVNGPAGARRRMTWEPPVRVVEVDRASAPGARNAAIEAAAHDTILFTDDDCLVPPGWCEGLSRELGERDVAAVAAPVRVAVEGPVTAYLDYKRVWDAPPATASTVRYFITANCGVRRDLIPRALRFDDRNLNVGGEDVEFSFGLRDAGLTIEWLPSHPPVVHVVGESIDQVTARFLRYGWAQARLSHRLGRWQQAVPGAHFAYEGILQAPAAGCRRFVEMDLDEARMAFAVYDLAESTSFLVGYLQGLGDHLGRVLVAADAPRLLAGWRAVAGRVGRLVDAVPLSTWRTLPVDVGRLAERSSVNRAVAWAGSIESLLRSHAPLTGEVWSDEAAEALVRWTEDGRAQAEEARRRLAVVLWSMWAAGGPTSAADLERRLRGMGISYSDGCGAIEGCLFSAEVGSHRSGPGDDRCASW